MTDDLVFRLRSFGCIGIADPTDCTLCAAADEIEALREERDRYFASACEWADQRDELRTLITAWAHAKDIERHYATCESVPCDICFPDDGQCADSGIGHAENALRKVVGR